MTGRYERDEREWLEADGLGGFASGTVSGVRTRRYHALLLAATTPPTGRMVLVNGFDAWVETADGGRHALTTQRYAPDTRHPDGAAAIDDFTADPWPAWTFALPDGTRVRQEILVARERAATVVVWRLLERASGAAADAFITRWSRWDDNLHGRIAANMRAQQRYRYRLFLYEALDGPGPRG